MAFNSPQESEGYPIASRPNNFIAQLPDEVLDLIVREAGPRHGTAASDSFIEEKETWLSCASVCRRWHALTLPHSFRWVRLTPYDFVAGDKRDDVPSRFQMFLHENPSIAQLIQELNVLTCKIEPKTLVSILAALPNLQYLLFQCSLFRGPLNHQILRTDFKIDKVLVSGGACHLYDCPPEICGQQIPHLLCLFSEIGEFQDLRRCEHADELVQELEGDAPQIHSLSTWPKLEPLYHNAMRKLGLFNDITCLHLCIASHRGTHELSHEFLCVVGPPLQELHLEVSMFTSELSGDPTVIAKEFCGGLAACRSLHGFRLIIMNGAVHGREVSARRTLQPAFLVGIEIIALLDVSQIKHLTFKYPPYMAADSDPEEIRVLPLSRLRDVSRRFVDLHSLNLVVYDAYNKVDIKTAFNAYAREELRELKDVLYLGEPRAYFRCDEPSCAWFSGGNLNSLITFQHEILKKPCTVR